jgi:hypothetical protein
MITDFFRTVNLGRSESDAVLNIRRRPGRRRRPVDFILFFPIPLAPNKILLRAETLVRSFPHTASDAI